MYDDRQGREQTSPTAWSVPSSNPRSLTRQIQAGVGQSTRTPASTSPRPLMPMARAAAGVRSITQPRTNGPLSLEVTTTDFKTRRALCRNPRSCQLASHPFHPPNPTRNGIPGLSVRSSCSGTEEPSQACFQLSKSRLEDRHALHLELPSYLSVAMYAARSAASVRDSCIFGILGCGSIRNNASLAASKSGFAALLSS
jgi:hypothetical protein